MRTIMSLGSRFDKKLCRSLHFQISSPEKKTILTLCLQVHRKYDLKGSTVDREASDKEKAKKDPTLKDMDFLNDGAKIKIGDDAREKLLETLTADVEFLTKNAIMDYSLLLGIHDTKRVRRMRLES